MDYLQWLQHAFAEGDPAAITDALGVVARAKGMTLLAAETALSRQALYKALSADGHPKFATVLKVASALGFRLEPHRIAELA